MSKRIVMIHTPERTIIDPGLCPHLNTVIQMPDDGEPYSQCLDCGWVYREDYTWGPKELPTDDDREYPDMFGEL